MRKPTNDELLARAQQDQNPESMTGLLMKYAGNQVTAMGIVNHATNTARAVKSTYLKGAADVTYLTGVLPLAQYEQVMFLGSIGRTDEAFAILGRAVEQHRETMFKVKS